MQIGEIVLRTSQFTALRSWYGLVLGQSPYFERQAQPGVPLRPGELQRASESTLCFFRLHLDHPFAQVVAIFEVPGTKRAASGDPGLHHMQLRVATVHDLGVLFVELKASDVLPFHCVDHGPGTSFYYRDPDGNVVELSATNFEREQDYLDHLTSAEFRNNPSGLSVDPDLIAARSLPP